MSILVKIIGLLIAVFGCYLFAWPLFTQKVFNFIREGKRIYWAGVVRSFVGLALLLAAARSPVPVAAIAVGILFLLSGIIVFACDLEKMKSLLAHYNEMSPFIIRLLGLIVACLGILVFSIV